MFFESTSKAVVPCGRVKVEVACDASELIWGLVSVGGLCCVVS